MSPSFSIVPGGDGVGFGTWLILLSLDENKFNDLTGVSERATGIVEINCFLEGGSSF